MKVGMPPFPDINPKDLETAWNRLGVQVFILLSLCLQIILLICGFRRKYIVRSWIRVLVWSAYLGANWMATFALGNLGNYQAKLELHCEKFPNSAECNTFRLVLTANKALKVSWSPFLLSLLGGPDTMSAYSLEDNELWSRTFFAFMANMWGVCYLIIVSWKDISEFLTLYISIPIFTFGIIKYGERVFVLWSASTERFKEYLLSNPDPFPNLVKITKQDMQKRLEEEEFEFEGGVVEDESHQIFEAFFLFKRFANLFAGLILDNNELSISYKIFSRKLAEDAFNVVAIELGIMYDMLYTKAMMVYSRWGLIFRCITFLTSISTVVFYSIILNIDDFPLVDLFITFSLLLVGVLLEVIAIIEFCSSDWAILILLTKHKKLRPSPVSGNRKRWSKVMGQFNLLSFSFQDISAKYITVQNFFLINKRMKNHLNVSWEAVTVDLQKMIFTELKEKIHKYELCDHFCETRLLRKVLDQRGDYVLKEKYKLDDFDWSIEEVEFAHSLLLWHIATDLCYYQDFDMPADTNNNIHQTSKFGKCLSDYMLYLLVVCPSVMPKGNGELMFRETCAMVRRFIESSEASLTSIKRVEDCKMLLINNIDHLTNDMSVLVEGCNLANKLQSLETRHGWSQEKKWKMIIEVWEEMLAYAANACDWIHHGHQLRRGGELLSHVRLLMSHLGLSEQYNKKGRKFDD